VNSIESTTKQLPLLNTNVTDCKAAVKR